MMHPYSRMDLTKDRYVVDLNCLGSNFRFRRSSAKAVTTIGGVWHKMDFLQNYWG